MATGYYVLLAFRVLTGIGSAAIVTLATPYIDDVSPASAKTLWFGMLYLVSPAFSAGSAILCQFKQSHALQ